MGYSEKFSYLKLGNTFDPLSYIFVEFYLETRDTDFNTCAEALAAESSIGTWIDVEGLDEDLFNRLSAKVYEINKFDDTNGVVKIAYPLQLFETDNTPQILSSIAGNVFGLKEIRNLRVRDVKFPEWLIKENKGPAFGISGIRETMKVFDRPLIGTIIKPKLGLSSDEHAEKAYEAWIGGVDIVKDDENLSDQDFNPFYERVTKTLDARKKAEEETGEKKLYCPNVSARISEMYARAKFVREQGGRAAMVDIVTVGYSGVQFIRDQQLDLILHGHRAMHGAFTHSDKHGISMLTIAKFARVIGIDQLHTGTVIGKMEGSKEEVTKINEYLRKEMYGMKPTMPIASGGLHPGHVEKIIEILGKDLIINMGGGIHGHPGGTADGAKAARQALEAASNGIDQKKAAETSPEFRLALEKWGDGSSKKDTDSKLYYALTKSEGASLKVRDS